jgi:hypothetical protein
MQWQQQDPRSRCRLHCKGTQVNVNCWGHLARGKAWTEANLLLHVPEHCGVPLKALHPIRVLIAAPCEKMQCLCVVNKFKVGLSNLREHPRCLVVLHRKRSKCLNGLFALVLGEQAVATAKSLQQLHNGSLPLQAVGPYAAAWQCWCGQLRVVQACDSPRNRRLQTKHRVQPRSEHGSTVCCAVSSDAWLPWNAAASRLSLHTPPDTIRNGEQAAHNHHAFLKNTPGRNPQGAQHRRQPLPLQNAPPEHLPF